MNDYFSEYFTNNIGSFQTLHKGIERNGYVTEDDAPFVSRPIYNSLNSERYHTIFKLHNPGRLTDVKASCTVFDVGDGFPSFYVAFDSRRFPDRSQLLIELKRVGVLK